MYFSYLPPCFASLFLRIIAGSQLVLAVAGSDGLVDGGLVWPLTAPLRSPPFGWWVWFSGRDWLVLVVRTTFGWRHPRLLLFLVRETVHAGSILVGTGVHPTHTS